jgi:nicotinate-nucleotide adenylyltransferase
MTDVGTIALFGGSFDPPHVGHQMVCLYALETHPVDRVLMVPTFRHAFGKELAPFPDRVAMCEIAASVFGGRVEVSRVEEDLGGESRTYSTLLELRRRLPGAGFRLLVGSDILSERDSWHRWGDVVAMAPPIVVARSGHPPKDPESAGPVLVEVSSSEVRERLSRGESAVPLLPRAVMDYIAGRGLYRPPRP